MIIVIVLVIVTDLTAVLCVGHSREEIDGHWHGMTGLPQVRRHNGEFGYRRNVTWLRQRSSFDFIEDTKWPPRATSTRNC